VSVTRDELAAALDGVRFPATKDDLVEHARGNDAAEVVAELDRLPARMTFSTTTEVSMRLKESTERV
jgi:hypothetical protein